MAMRRALDEQTGRCWGCGYLLRGIESGKCPECGRGFDWKNRTTFNLGRPIWRWRRGLMMPPGIFLCSIVFVGVGVMDWGTGWAGDWDFWRWDRTLTQWENLLGFWKAGGVRWQAFVIGLVISILIGAIAVLLVFIGRMLIKLHDPPDDL